MTAPAGARVSRHSSSWTRVAGWRTVLQAPHLSREVQWTYRCQWWYSALGGAAAGILTNAPTIGIKVLHAADWHLAFPTGLSGFGLLMSLVLGVWMARRPKLPFVLIPGFISAAICLAMVVTMQPLWFLFLLGLCNLFETITRPAIAAVIRTNYPVESRGWITGKLRQWSAGTFLAAAFATAWLLDFAGTWAVIQAIIAAAAALQAGAYLAFSLIRVRPGSIAGDDELPMDWRAMLPGAISTLRRDVRFLRYLCGCFLFGLGALTYDPIVRAYFSNELHLNYRQCVVLVDVLPSVCSVLTVQRLGAWLDRTNPLLAWAAIRLVWGLDPLILAMAPVWPSGALAIAAVARVLRGSVMNGSWILWWQLGTNYFTESRALTSVYMGAQISLNGVQRVLGPPLGASLGMLLSRREVLLIGGCLVLVSAFHAWRQAEAEKVDGRYPTFADKELAELAT